MQAPRAMAPSKVPAEHEQEIWSWMECQERAQSRGKNISPFARQQEPITAFHLQLPSVPSTTDQTAQLLTGWQIQQLLPQAVPFSMSSAQRSALAAAVGGCSLVTR